jgi:hypothetical protein
VVEGPSAASEAEEAGCSHWTENASWAVGTAPEEPPPHPEKATAMEAAARARTVLVNEGDRRSVKVLPMRCPLALEDGCPTPPSYTN